MNKSLVTFSLVALIGSPVAWAQDVIRVAEVPNFAVGDEWQLSSQIISDRGNPVASTERVESVDINSVWISSKGADQVRNWHSLDSKHSRKSARFDFDDNASDKRGKKTSEGDSKIQFPIEVGKTYKIKQKWVNSRGTEGTSDMSATVKSLEKVTVAAGQFEAFQIDIKGWWNITGYSGRLQETLWYAPEVKRVVKSEWKDFNSNTTLNEHRTSELTGFKLGQTGNGPK